MSFSTDRQLQQLLPPSTGPSYQPFRAPQPQPLTPAPGASSRAAAPALGPSRGRPRARSPVLIASATPEILEAQRRQREMEEIAAIEGKQKAREKKKLKEMERTMKNDLRRTLSRESGGSGTVNRFSFQPEPEDVMIPPLRFTQVKNSWLLVPPTLPPLLPLTPLMESPPLTEPPPLMESPPLMDPPPLMESPPLTEPLYQCHPTQNQVQVRSKTNLARLLLTFELFLVF